MDLCASMHTKSQASPPTMAIHNVFVLLLSLLLATLTPSLSAPTFITIDCGSNTSLSSDIFPWQADDSYVQNGDSYVVQYTSTIPLYMSETAISTLRAFPTLKKNCYTVNVGEGRKVLVRASFFYGNYDGKESPPTFELHFDGNFWATVNTSSLRGVYHEAIYVTKRNTTSVCVAQTLEDQIPFISGLEIRSLEMSMYSHVDSGRALFLSNRANAGANFTTRYPDDAYDRIWRAEGGFVLVDNVINEAPSIDASKAEDQPPIAVLRTATTTTGTSWGIVLNTDLPASIEPIYITAYFSEVTHLPSNQTRSIQVEINHVPFSKPFVPPFGSVSELRITNRTANSNTSVAVFADSSSTLPPLLSAYEVYTVSGLLTDGTNSDDVEGLAALQENFDVLQKWSGDPCLPSSFSWEWLECNSDASPRVTTLNLGSFGLSGRLPDFSSMIELETIDLHNNSLSGPIPSFLGLLPKLKLLNLADNRFSGTIPKSLSQNKNLKLIVTGNCLSGMSCPPPPSSSTPSVKTPPPYGNAEGPIAGSGAAEGPVAGSGVQSGGAEGRKMSSTLTTILSLSLFFMFLELKNL
ncbi:probable LRR receptor-like serine/threonine-protein kinase At5g59680 [Prosopis cineraria]|uniref:probable LRR receptor-like serine/threonine-protein kinase At5g59680 n=1 Tax=Prosopis cineraria TaxID=364024 RepID=UPI00240F6DB4|nr:probable LRR receptor-like serine/threonine-protein kinase At5g59680 [Prosopis cineraria]